MIFEELKVEGSYSICPEFTSDERGQFGRTYCSEEFHNHKINLTWKQMNLSTSKLKSTFRGFHLQRAPKAEDKLIRCTRGAVWDYVVDLRLDSPTLGHWDMRFLSESNKNSLFVPKGCAHGFLTAEDNTTVMYLVSENYSPAHEIVLNCFDIDLNIHYEEKPKILSRKDLNGISFIKILDEIRNDLP